MQWDQLWSAFKKRRGQYFLWLMANLGGLVVAYMACLTIWIFHRNLGNYVPGPEVVLISGTISLAVAGVSYVTLSRRPSVSLSPLFALSWAFLMAIVYGLLIAMGVKTPVVGNTAIWSIILLVTLGCLFWSSVTWLQEQGIRIEMEEEVPMPPEGPPRELEQAATELPRLESESDASEEEA